MFSYNVRPNRYINDAVSIINTNNNIPMDSNEQTNTVFHNNSQQSQFLDDGFIKDSIEKKATANKNFVASKIESISIVLNKKKSFKLNFKKFI